MAESDTPERKETAERRVYTLPSELLARLRAYQISQNIPSEVEAARRLLDSALQLRDSIEDILDRVGERYKEEKDLRVIASEILIKHYLVQTVRVIDEGLVFILKSGDGGQINHDGALLRGHRDMSDDNWERYKPIPNIKTKPVTSGGGWDNDGGDLDEEIPF